jgi:hypothetical protein
MPFSGAFGVINSVIKAGVKFFSTSSMIASVLDGDPQVPFHHCRAPIPEDDKEFPARKILI